MLPRRVQMVLICPVLVAAWQQIRMLERISRATVPCIHEQPQPKLCLMSSPGSGVSAFRRSSEVESRGHFDQIGERVGLHLLHHLASVRLHRDLADAEFASDLFIQ